MCVLFVFDSVVFLGGVFVAFVVFVGVVVFVIFQFCCSLLRCHGNTDAETVCR